MATYLEPRKKKVAVVISSWKRLLKRKAAMQTTVKQPRKRKTHVVARSYPRVGDLIDIRRIMEYIQ